MRRKRPSARVSAKPPRCRRSGLSAFRNRYGALWLALVVLAGIGGPGLHTEVRMIKGVGPQRAELLAKRGIYTLEDLLNYLPFRYEDRIQFTKIRNVQPNGTYTLRAQVMSGQAVRGMYGRDAIYHLLVQDDSGSLPCKFFHGGYLEGRLKPGQELILHGKVEIDRLRPARREMVNPHIEIINASEE